MSDPVSTPPILLGARAADAATPGERDMTGRTMPPATAGERDAELRGSVTAPAMANRDRMEGDEPAPSGHGRAVACLFASRMDADRAADDLVNEGIPRSTIEIVDQRREATSGTTAESGGVWGSIKRLFGGEDTSGYYEGVNRGQVLLTAHVHSPAEADRISGILERHNPLDLDAQEASWRESGWTGGMASTGGTMAGPRDVAPEIGPDVASAKPAARTEAIGEPAMAGRSTEPRPVERAGEQVIPVVREDVAIGKRAVAGGRVRVHAYMVETPISEDVSLRDERVEVERRPVDRPLSEAGAAVGDDAFRDRSIEATATREEAVVGKTARVVEEVVLRKEAGERVEHVNETARRTEVKVEDDRTGMSPAPAGTIGPDQTRTKRP